MNNELILKRIKDADSNYLCGDIWIDIEYEGFEHGIFCQVEFKEYENDIGYYDNIYSVFCYKNMLTEEGHLTSDYSDTVAQFDFKYIPEKFDFL